MGMERYLSAEIVPGVVIQEVQNRNALDKSRGVNKSPYYTLACLFMEEGRDGLRELAKKMGKTTIVAPDSTTLNQLSPEDRQAYVVNFASLLFGITMKAVETALAEQICDPAENCDLYNEAITGTIIPKAKPPQIIGNQLTQDQWREMVSYSKRDRSHAIFFDEGYQSLPECIRIPLEQSNALPIIKQIILPSYRAYAAQLVA